MSEAADKYWVVIPAYNEAATVRDVAMRARQQCRHVVVVDDGSVDGTAQALAGLNVTVLRNEDNRGKAGSLVRGFDHALSHGALGVITLDADGQHAPEEIPCLIEVARSNQAAFVLGARHREQRRASSWRYAANCIADFWISWAAGQWIEDSQSGFRLYPAGLLKQVRLNCNKGRSFVFESEILIEAGRSANPIGTVEISVSNRKGPRPSHFRPILDIARIVIMVGGKLLATGMNPAGFVRALGAVRGKYQDRAEQFRSV